ncbi:MAG: glycosyltransferase [Ignavibacteriales bacterium]|nr:glycosyltransferase [Ignavibacteriales bacterium]
MKVILSSNKNPYIETFTEYIHKAFEENFCETKFFENRNFIIPGRIRDRIHALHLFDLERMNRQLIKLCQSFKPDLFLEAGGWNILPETIVKLKTMGIITALWTIDPPRIFQEIINVSPYYDFVFCQGTEAVEILIKYRKEHLYWMPFACDPDIHKPVSLSLREQEKYKSDICFVGSGWTSLYPERHQYLEQLADFNLSIWGPGWFESKNQKLSPYIKQGFTKPEEWIKIFSAAKIVFHSHFTDPEGEIPCYQASPRVYEVLACEALLLVDNQPDVLALFEDREHLVVFRSEQELQNLAKYYLENETERKQIAKKGKEFVLKKHTFKHRVKEILTIIENNG